MVNDTKSGSVLNDACRNKNFWSFFLWPWGQGGMRSGHSAVLLQYNQHSAKEVLCFKRTCKELFFLTLTSCSKL